MFHELQSRPESMNPRPRLLFLAQTLPFPPDAGVHIRTYNIMKLLSREYDISALCFFRKTERPTSRHVRESVAGLEQFARVQAFPIPQEHSRARLIEDHLKSVMLGRAYTRFAYESKEFRNALETLLATESFELAHVDSLDLVAYLPMLKGIPVVCVHHNVESALLERRAATSGGVRGKYLTFQATLTEKEEIAWCPRVALNAAVSEADRAQLQALVPTAKFVVVPNGVDIDEYRPAVGLQQSGIVFVGGYSWEPNREAMEFFARDVLPRIRARHPSVTVTWAGRAPAAVMQKYRDQYGIELTGYLDDIRPIVQRSACYIAPLKSGGGTRLKILDAWAMGKAVVSTTVGCEGLEASDGRNILVRDTAEAFSDAVISLLGDPSLRDAIGHGARKTAEDFYDWEVIGKPMLRSYKALHQQSR